MYANLPSYGVSTPIQEVLDEMDMTRLLIINSDTIELRR